ncbi:hypothetical protein [Dickeya dadantii]|uniref:hypothetical protein n=1 Tax=Dickeya dadantii TaxID=204038 RepID=UPI0021D85C1C|nr:hypothetical protein [Dickeya dadantii]
MPINGWYTGDADNVMDNGNINGWADQSGLAFGSNLGGGVQSYQFGPVINHYGTWGQLIYINQGSLAAPDWNNPSGLNGWMPVNPAPDNSIWIQGHLVNGECGGQSNHAAYLTPISHNVNMWHAGYEAVLQRLVNRGAATGVTVSQFNPHGLANCRIIYRTQGLPPRAGSQVPDGICVSLGIVINGVMKNEAEVAQEFAHGAGKQRWFADRYYTSSGKDDRNKIIEMVGGTLVQYP